MKKRTLESLLDKAITAEAAHVQRVNDLLASNACLHDRAIAWRQRAHLAEDMVAVMIHLLPGGTVKDTAEKFLKTVKGD